MLFFEIEGAIACSGYYLQIGKIKDCNSNWKNSLKKP